MRKLIISLLFLGSVAFAQNARFDNVALGPRGPIPGATVAVCTQPAVTTTQPCSPLANLCSSLSDVTCIQPNPLTADSLGNYHFYVKQTQSPFTVQIYGPQVATPLVIPDQTVAASLGLPANWSFPGTFTNTQANLYVTDQVGGINIGTFFASTFGGSHQTDGISGGVQVPVGATVINNDGVAGYCNTVADSASRTKANCAGLFGLAGANANNSAAWGINTVVFDAAGLTGHNMTGYENDMNLLGTPAFMKGFILTGLNQGGTVPASAVGYEVATPYKFPFGFVCDRASCNVGAQFNDQLSTNPSISQSVQFVSHDGGGSPHVAQINEDSNGNEVVTDLSGGPNPIAQRIASGTATMTTAAITAGNCGTTVTVSATGVATTDTITWAFNAAPAGSNAGLVAWPTANNVNFAYCSNTAQTPAAATINWRVVR